MKQSCTILLFFSFFTICYYVSQSSCEQHEKVKDMKTNKKMHETEPILGTIQSHDGITLAYACYVPEQPKAALVFYHGSTVHGLAGYTYLAEQLAKKFRIATFLFDIRGHGRSEGPPGDAPSVEVMWHDVRTALSYVEDQYKDMPVFLGGHSGGAGMLINYASWHKNKQPAGYVLVAPLLGRHAQVIHQRQAKSNNPFVRVNHYAFIIHEITYGLIGGRWHALSFNYSDQLAKEKGFVKHYTVNMAQSMHPHDPFRSLCQISVPLLICIAQHDELFDATKMDTFFEPIVAANKHISIKHVDAHHLTVLGIVHDAIGDFLTC